MPLKNMFFAAAKAAVPDGKRAWTALPLAIMLTGDIIGGIKCAYSNAQGHVSSAKVADTHRTIPDNSIRVIDMDKYQLGVAVVNCGAMGSAAPANANAAGGGNAAPTTPCGEQRPGATSPNGI